MSQTIEYRVRVVVDTEPFCDDYDQAIIAAALGDAVEALRWPGVDAEVDTL